MTGRLEINLPYPPSNNRYWRRVGGRTLLSREARHYRAAVAVAVKQANSCTFGDSRISVSITSHAPDRRRRDLDNLPKGILDAMQKCGVYHDDSQVDRLQVVRGDVRRGDASVDVVICEVMSTR